MLERFLPAVQLDIGVRQITVTMAHGWKRRVVWSAQHELPENELLDVSLLSEQFVQLLAQGKAQSCVAKVVIDDEWVRFFNVVPPANSKRLADCQAAAQLRFQTLYGEPASHWRLQANWDYRAPFLACALPHNVASALNELARRMRWTLTEVAPRFMREWNRHCDRIQPGQWLGIVSSRVLTLGITDAHGLVGVRSRPLSEPSHMSAWLQNHVVQESLRLGIELPTLLHLGGEIPAAWLAEEASVACQRIDVAEMSTRHMNAAKTSSLLGGAAQ